MAKDVRKTVARLGLMLGIVLWGVPGFARADVHTETVEYKEQRSVAGYCSQVITHGNFQVQLGVHGQVHAEKACHWLQEWAGSVDEAFGADPLSIRQSDLLDVPTAGF